MAHKDQKRSPKKSGEEAKKSRTPDRKMVAGKRVAKKKAAGKKADRKKGKVKTAALAATTASAATTAGAAATLAREPLGGPPGSTEQARAATVRPGPAARIAPAPSIQEAPGPDSERAATAPASLDQGPLYPDSKKPEQPEDTGGNTMVDSSSSSTGGAAMRFWPKIIVWLVVIVVGFMYVRSLAHKESKTAAGGPPATSVAAPAGSAENETLSVGAELAPAVGEPAAVIAVEVESAGDTEQATLPAIPETSAATGSEAASAKASEETAQAAPEETGAPLPEMAGAESGSEARAVDAASVVEVPPVIEVVDEIVVETGVESEEPAMGGSGTESAEAMPVAPRPVHEIATAPKPAAAMPVSAPEPEPAAAVAEQVESGSLVSRAAVVGEPGPEAAAAEAPAMPAPRATPYMTPYDAEARKEYQAKLMAEFAAMRKSAAEDRETMRAQRRGRYPLWPGYGPGYPGLQPQYYPALPYQPPPAGQE